MAYGYGYGGATHDDVYEVASSMQPGDEAKTFSMREIGTPVELEQLMDRLKQGRDGVAYMYSRDGSKLTVHCTYPRTIIE